MSDAEYYLQREQAERALADAAKDPAIRAIHDALVTGMPCLPALNGIPPRSA
jgi:hypothetical protein